jgi:hypothetical protein
VCALHSRGQGVGGPSRWRRGIHRVSSYVYYNEYYGGVGMGSRLSFECIRSVGCGLGMVSVAS